MESREGVLARLSDLCPRGLPLAVYLVGRQSPALEDLHQRMLHRRLPASSAARIPTRLPCG